MTYKHAMIKAGAFSRALRQQQAREVVRDMLIKRAKGPGFFDSLMEGLDQAKTSFTNSNAGKYVTEALRDPRIKGAAAGGALGLLASLFSKNRSLGKSLGWTAAGLGLGGLAGEGYKQYTGVAPAGKDLSTGAKVGIGSAIAGTAAASGIGGWQLWKHLRSKAATPGAVVPFSSAVDLARPFSVSRTPVAKRISGGFKKLVR